MTTRKRAKRSPATAGSTKWSAIAAASVPGRGEKMNVKASSKRGVGSHLEGALEVVVGLAREADDDVRRDREIGHDATGLGEAFEVAGRGVATVHGGEHPVGPGLQRVVQLRAHGRRLGDRGERVGPHVLRVRRGEADAPDPRDGAGGAQQVGEQRTHASPGVTAAPRR